MKTKLLILISSLACVSAANAQSVLLGGYHGGNESGDYLQSATLTPGNVVVSLTRSGLASDITQGFSQISTSNWGTTALDVAAPTGQSPAELAIFQANGDNANDQVLTLSITNSGAVDLVLDAIHWNIKKDFADEGPNLQSLTYTTGDLADANGLGTGNFTLANGTNGHDIDLSSFLTDTTLSVGQTATFTWTHGAAELANANPGANTAIRMDNFAISGSVVPEASAAALVGLAGLALLRRRR